MQGRGRSTDTPEHGAVHGAGGVGQHGGMSQATTREQGPAMQDEIQKTETTTTNPTLGRSTVAKLPAELREAVDKAIAEGATIDEITARIREGGESCSRSAVGRYAKEARALIQKRQEADRVVKAWMQEFGDRPQGELARVLIQSLRAMALATIERMSEREEPVSMEELARFSVVLKRIESTDELRLRREQVAQQAADAAKPEPEPKPKPKSKPKPRKALSPEVVARIDEAVLGKPRWPARTVTSVPVDPWNPAEFPLIPLNPGKSRPATAR